MADAKNTVLFPYETLKKLSMDAFQKFGFSEKEADIIQDVLLTSDLFGIQSHGMQRMVRYHKGITNGLIKIDAKPEIVKETPISAVIDGHDGMGQLLGHKAMEMAIEKAKKSGVGIVSVSYTHLYLVVVHISHVDHIIFDIPRTVHSFPNELQHLTRNSTCL